MHPQQIFLHRFLVMTIVCSAGFKSHALCTLQRANTYFDIYETNSLLNNEQNQKNMHKQIYTQKWIDSHLYYLANSYRTLQYKRVHKRLSNIVLCFQIFIDLLWEKNCSTGCWEKLFKFGVEGREFANFLISLK